MSARNTGEVLNTFQKRIKQNGYRKTRDPTDRGNEYITFSTYY